MCTNKQFAKAPSPEIDKDATSGMKMSSSNELILCDWFHSVADLFFDERWRHNQKARIHKQKGRAGRDKLKEVLIFRSAYIRLFYGEEYEYNLARGAWYKKTPKNFEQMTAGSWGSNEDP